MAAKKTVVDWATELLKERRELDQIEYQLLRDRQDVAAGEANAATTKKRIQALQAEVCIAAGIIPDRPRPDSSEPLDPDEMAAVHDVMNNAQRELLAETDPVALEEPVQYKPKGFA